MKRYYPSIIFNVWSCDLDFVLIASKGEGVCEVRLGDSYEAMIKAFEVEYPEALITDKDTTLNKWAASLIQYINGHDLCPTLPVDVCGTVFQEKVWQYLRQIPFGETRTYSDIAQAIGSPKAVRAAANACAHNPVALIIPCHRIIRKSGGFEGYRWGTHRKKYLLDLEQSFAHV